MEIGVIEAARRLNVDPSRVRQLIRSGAIEGRRLGRAWVVDDRVLDRVVRHPASSGRPLAPLRAWGLLDVLSGGGAPWLSPVARSQVRALARGFAYADPNRWRSALRGRADVHRVRAHRSAIPRLLALPEAVESGPAVAAMLGVDLVALDAIPDLYLPEDSWRQAADRLRLVDDNSQFDAVIRVPRGLWPFAESPLVLRAASAADLLDSEEPRAVEQGWSMLVALARAV